MVQVAVILPNWVGDFVMSFASLDPIMEKTPLVLCGKKGFYELIRGKYKEVVWIEKKGILKTAFRLMRTDAKTAVLLPNSFSSALLATLSGMPRIIGLPTDGRFFLLTKKVRLNTEKLHQAEIYRKILEAAGLSFSGKLKSKLYPAEKDILWAEEKIKSLGWEGERILAIHPGASKPQRRWPQERFAETAKRAEKKGYKIAVVGSEKEKELAKAVVEGIKKTNFVNLCEENLPLGRLAAFISRCTVFLGNDSGPIHIASAFGLKVVGIYGPGVPERTGPVLGENTVFKAVTLRYPCSPCRERFFKDCKPINGLPPCLWEISVDMVWETLKEVL